MESGKQRLESACARFDGRDLGLLWLQNRQHTWWNVAENNPIPPVKSATVTVRGVHAGRYRVEFFDTWKGGVISKARLRAKNDEIPYRHSHDRSGYRANAIWRGKSVTDAYCHLDMDAESPIADIEQRRSAANISGALLVETWDGRNASMLRLTDKFSVALCYRCERRRELL